jgi:sugar/nucleoside kinase (ribokinase family)
MNKECLVIGDLNIDLIFNGLSGFPELGKEILSRNYDMVIGGSGGVFAAVLSKLGIRTIIISKIGNDNYGRFLLDEMKKDGADASRMIISESMKTGITVSLSYEEDKSQISSINLIKSFKAEEINLENLDSVRHVHFSAYYMMDSLKNSYVKIIENIKSRYKEITFSLDTNDDPYNEWGPSIYEILKNIDILFLNKKEAMKISREPSVQKAADKLANYTKKVVIKLGKEGYIAKINGKYYQGHCRNTGNKNFLDGTGSGDNFDAGFVFGFLKEFDIEKTLDFANCCAEKSIEYSGGVGCDAKFAQIRSIFKIN